MKKGAQKVRVVWLQDRVVEGKWSMGCAICAKLRARILQEGSPACRRQQKKWDCKWGRFEISSLSQCQVAALSNHAMSQCHRAAMNSLEDPSAPLEALVQPEASDEALLQGHVPQPEDWLKAFCLVRNPVSFLKGEKQSENDSYISIRKCKVSRFSMKSLSVSWRRLFAGRSEHGFRRPAMSVSLWTTKPRTGCCGFVLASKPGSAGKKGPSAGMASWRF